MTIHLRIGRTSKRAHTKIDGLRGASKEGLKQLLVSKIGGLIMALQGMVE